MEKPETVKHAALLWATAIVAGIVETVLAVSEIARDSGIDAGVWTNIGVRSTVYIGVFVLVANFVRGRRWARASLVVLLSVIGLAAMVVPSTMQLADGEPLVAAVGGHGDFAIAFFVVRLAHIAAVLLATALMFSPSANRYFRMPLPATEPVTA
jgi:phosphoglycerol transferase MdoB-like AlkP superfamily enzyme